MESVLRRMQFFGIRMENKGKNRGKARVHKCSSGVFVPQNGISDRQS